MDVEEQELATLAFVRSVPELADARKPIDRLRRQLKTRRTTMVLQERQPDNPRQTFRHHRGEWLSPREEVTGGIPSLFDWRRGGRPHQSIGIRTLAGQ